MRRTGITTLASVVVFAMVPANALAHRHHGHHHRSHRHSQAHTENFGNVGSSSGQAMAPSSPAGTVQSFNSSTGVLTIAVTGGTVSGTVTSATELECEAPGSMSTSHEDGDRGGSGGGDGPGDGNEGMEEQTCTTANLTPGTAVQGAELRLSGTGATWERVVLEVAGATS